MFFRPSVGKVEDEMQRWRKTFSNFTNLSFKKHKHMFVYWRVEFPVLRKFMIRTPPPKMSPPIWVSLPMVPWKATTLITLHQNLWRKPKVPYEYHTHQWVSSSWRHYHFLSPVLRFSSRTNTYTEDLCLILWNTSFLKWINMWIVTFGLELLQSD